MGEENTAIEKESATPIDKKILKNFYLSFKFSQGSPDLQCRMLTAIARLYTQSELFNQFSSAQAINQELLPKVQNIQTPNWHTKKYPGGEDITSKEKKEEMLDEWFRQIDIFKLLYAQSQHSNKYRRKSDVLDGKAQSTFKETPEELILYIVNEMAGRDLRYLKIGRPRNNKPNQDTESFTKTYVLEQKPTGSQQFDQLFSQVRTTTLDIFENGRVPEEVDSIVKDMTIDSLRELKAFWEERHGIGSFFPEKQDTPIAA